jgi:hypothetical protein
MGGETRSWITVVSGLPRSGTSMMMQMLAAGGLPVLADHVRAADEDNARGYFEFESVKRTREDPSWLRGAAGKAVKMVYLLLYDLPPQHQYRVIFMQRTIEEVLASQRAMLQRRGTGGADLSPEQMGAAFRRQLEKVDQWLTSQPQFQVLKVDYHDVVTSPVAQAERVCEFLGAGLDAAARAAAVDPAMRRQGVGSR